MRNNYLHKKMIEEIGKCELCGNKRGLEIHHIIPLSLISDNPYANTQENLLCVCKKCHSLLTPTKLLTSIGVRKAHERYIQDNKVGLFYKELDEICEAGERMEVVDILDKFDKYFAR